MWLRYHSGTVPTYFALCLHFGGLASYPYVSSNSDVTPKLGQIVDIPNSTCEEKSHLWDEETYTTLEGSCERLLYDKQHCSVERSEWDCMRKRALMHDSASCDCIRPQHYVHGCIYVEICVFVDPSLECDKNYKCSVDHKDNITINCTGEGLKPYTNRCHRGLLHCPRDVPCDEMNLAMQFASIIKDTCGNNYTEMFGENVTVYFIDQVLYNNTSHGFGNITALILAKNDQNNACKRDFVDYTKKSPPIQSQLWKSIVPVLLVFVIVVALSYGGWKLKRSQTRQNKKWKEIISETVGGTIDFVFGTDGTVIPTDSSSIIFESPDPIQQGNTGTQPGDTTNTQMPVESQYSNGDVTSEIPATQNESVENIEPTLHGARRSSDREHSLVNVSDNVSVQQSAPKEGCLASGVYCFQNDISRLAGPTYANTSSQHSSVSSDSAVFFTENDYENTQLEKILESPAQRNDITASNLHTHQYSNLIQRAQTPNQHDYRNMDDPSLSLNPQHLDNPVYFTSEQF